MDGRSLVIVVIAKIITRDCVFAALKKDILTRTVTLMADKKRAHAHRWRDVMNASSSPNSIATVATSAAGWSSFHHYAISNSSFKGNGVILPWFQRGHKSGVIEETRDIFYIEVSTVTGSTGRTMMLLWFLLLLIFVEWLNYISFCVKRENSSNVFGWLCERIAKTSASSLVPIFLEGLSRRTRIDFNMRNNNRAVSYPIDLYWNDSFPARLFVVATIVPFW